mgnify:FL=1
MTGFVVGLVLLVVWAALYLARFRSHDIEGWQVVKVLKVAEPKKVESQEVIDERAACAAIAEVVERDKQMPDSMRSVAARIRILIQQRGVK